MAQGPNCSLAISVGDGLDEVDELGALLSAGGLDEPLLSGAADSTPNCEVASCVASVVRRWEVEAVDWWRGLA
jgi:hypothetical protein